jgi:hypothetical protein
MAPNVTKNIRRHANRAQIKRSVLLNTPSSHGRDHFTTQNCNAELQLTNVAATIPGPVQSPIRSNDDWRERVKSVPGSSTEGVEDGHRLPCGITAENQYYHHYGRQERKRA